MSLKGNLQEYALYDSDQDQDHNHDHNSDSHAISSHPSTANSTPLLSPSCEPTTPLLAPMDSFSKSARKLSVSSFENLTIFDLLDPTSYAIELSKSQTYQKVKNYSTTSLKKLNDKRKQKKIKFNISNEELHQLKQQLHKQVDKTYLKIDKTLKASQTEKLYYAATIYIIFLMGICIGKHPAYFHVFYTVISCVLLPIRFLTYYKMNYGYYLADLCYFVNALVFLFIWVWPDSKMLFVTCASFSWGTLSFAVITWKNKLVLHSIEKTTSTFIHVLPPTVMYVITHQIPKSVKKQRFPGAMKLETWDLWYGVFYTSLMYFVWQMSYHYFITIRKAEKIKNGKVTSFEYLRKAFANKPIGKFVNSLPGNMPVVAFSLLQYMYQLCTMSLCPIFFKYKYAASAFVSFIFLTASYNGATYYIDFYGKRLQKEVERLQAEISDLRSKNGGDSPEMIASNGTSTSAASGSGSGSVNGSHVATKNIETSAI
ncbi:unnamed protein product [Ambrosiozyma monospora]|uniref:Glycerophosphocholine acyltransferase 1 n=1 Tax=Ambrosiozyma monospora TaxID=43982 RepID=A0A9W6YVD2_AMBMO|nr:unnamed protein product [Ambrosiozyma monospora]